MAKIQLRRGTSAQWLSANPVLAAGEPGRDTTLKRSKTGDGVSAWSVLPWDAPTKTELDQNYAPQSGFISAAAFGVSPTATPAENRSRLQQAVDAATTQRKALYIPEQSGSDWIRVDGTVSITGTVEIFGAGRTSRLHQTQKPKPLFDVQPGVLDVHVTGVNFTADGLDMTGMGNPANFQNYVGIRVHPSSHGFQIRSCYGKDIYCVALVRILASTDTPVRMERFVADGIEVDGVWSAVHGGPFLNPVINDIRGSYRKAFSSDGVDTGQKPHLVYTNSNYIDTAAPGGIWDANWRSKGGKITNIAGKGAPNTGAVVALKHHDGLSGGNITGVDCPGLIEVYALADSNLIGAVGLDDKYPRSGEESGRASVTFAYSRRTNITGITVSHAAMDHGAAVMFESTSEDCSAEVTVISRRTVDVSADQGGTNVTVAGQRNTVRPRVFNKGLPAHSPVRLVGTGAYGKVIDPKVTGSYTGTVRVENNHAGGMIDYDPMLCRSAGISVATGASVLIRDRSVGQLVAPGALDLFERDDSTALVYSDDGKPYQILDTGTNASRWGIVGGRAKYLGGTARSCAVVDAKAADGVFTGTVGAISTANGGFSFRVQDANNFLYILLRQSAGTNRIQLMRRLSGTAVSLGISAAGALSADGSVIEVVLAGTSISVKLNGTEVIAPVTVSDFSTLTKHGLWGDSSDQAISYEQWKFAAA